MPDLETIKGDQAARNGAYVRTDSKSTSSSLSPSCKLYEPEARMASVWPEQSLLRMDKAATGNNDGLYLVERLWAQMENRFVRHTR